MDSRYLFRLWNKKEKSYGSHENALSIMMLGNRQSNGVSEKSDTLDCFSIEQCTGLKDKNGKLIFEGDKLDINIDELVHVFWWNGSWLIKGGWLSGDDLMSYADESLIKGTIHDGN